MRKLMMAVMAVAAAGMMTTGCSRRSEVKRQEVAETRADLAQAQQEARPEVTQPRVEDQQALAPAARDMNQYVQVDQDREQVHAEALMDLAGAHARDLSARMNPDESSATGGSGLTEPEGEVVVGTVQAVTEKSLTIIIPAEDNRLMRLMVNDPVPVTRAQQPVTLQSLKAGSEVRASYQVEPSGLRTLRSLDITRVSEPPPAMMKQ